MRGFRTPLLIALIVSLGLGLGVGWKLRRDRAARAGVVTSSRKLRLLALTGAFPPAVLSGFRSTENIEIEMVEEPTPESLALKLDADPSFDLVTLLSSQTSRALQTSRIQPFIEKEILGLSNVSRDFIDLPARLPLTIPFAWGLLGFAYNPETVDDVRSWENVLDLDSGTRIALKPYAYETLRLAKLGMPTPFADNALQDRLKKFNSIYKRTSRFLADPGNVEAEGDVVELSFSEATIGAYKDMKFVLPSDRALLWVLNLALTSGSKNIDEAKAFANYILKPAAALEIASANHEATTNTGLESSALLPTQKPSSLRRIPLTQIDLLFDDSKN